MKVAASLGFELTPRMALAVATDLPIVVEIVDTLDRIEAFLPVIDGAIADGLAIVEKVQIRFYRSGSGQK
jgi:PII-like signaling protein